MRLKREAQAETGAAIAVTLRQDAKDLQSSDDMLNDDACT